MFMSIYTLRCEVLKSGHLIGHYLCYVYAQYRKSENGIRMLPKRFRERTWKQNIVDHVVKMVTGQFTE
jgi:hypothetical protein